MQKSPSSVAVESSDSDRAHTFLVGEVIVQILTVRVSSGVSDKLISFVVSFWC